ncbi:helix-turn-helix domain-containing protein [Oscillatoria amoena NRMC-F 0135]|nr:helix-turn-helix domain-containing protein [Oscillatoria amoena NRMC-F 0135]
MELLHSSAIVNACDEFHEDRDYFTRRRKGAGDWLIFYTLSGHGLFTGGGQRSVSAAGDVHLYQPGFPHDYRTFGEKWRFLWAHFQPHEYWLPWLNLPRTSIEGLSTLRILREPLRRKTAAALRKMLAASRLPAHHKRHLILNSLEEALLWISEANPHLRDISRDDRIEEALEILGESFTEKHTVESLARRVGLSPSRFAHLFKEQTGQSVIDTVIHLRLAEACKLMEFTSLPIKSIAAQCGFQNAYYFSRIFKEKHIRSPKAWRQKRLSGECTTALEVAHSAPTPTPTKKRRKPPVQR